MRPVVLLLLSIPLYSQTGVLHVVGGIADLTPITTKVATKAANDGSTSAASTQYADRAAAAASGSSTPGYQPNQVLTGCGVEYTSGLSFTVGACNYIIAGTRYSSPLTTVTLSAADPTNPRIDVIAVNASSTAVVITGTPAGSPVQPTVDSTTQLQLTFVQVAANATTPSGVASTLIYDEGTGGPGEWNLGSISGGGGTIATTTNNPYHLTHALEATTIGPGATFTFSIPSGNVNLSTFNNLTFYIRSKGAWPANTSIAIFWQNASVQKGVYVLMVDGAFGFNSSTGSYQQVSIPTNLFGTGSNTVTQLKFIVSLPVSTTMGWYIDEVTLQNGLSPSPASTTLMNFRGAWASTTAYNPNDVVISSGIAYVALVANTNVSVTTTSTWSAFGTNGSGTINSGTTGQTAVYTANGTTVGGSTNLSYRTFGVTFDGGGSALSGTSTRCTQINYAGTINEFTMVSDVSGNATVKVQTVAYGSYTGPGSSSDISNGGETMTGAVKTQDTTLTGWTTALSANTVVCFALSSPATITWLSANVRISGSQ